VPAALEPGLDPDDDGNCDDGDGKKVRTSRQLCRLGVRSKQGKDKQASVLIWAYRVREIGTCDRNSSLSK
jgi:hypothetical protein